MQIPGLNLDEIWICCDLDRHVYFARHTDAQVVEALRDLALVRPDRVDGVRPGPRARP